jgi:hypothetical protein
MRDDNTPETAALTMLELKGRSRQLTKSFCDVEL